MKTSAIIPLIFIFSCGACVDRISFDVGSPTTFPVVIDGYISDEPGPYTIKISKAFDIESKLSIKTPISVKKIIVSDNLGTREELARIKDGEYQTSSTGIRGTIGRVYTLDVELLDGRVYKSKPDTLFPSGNVESVYHKYKAEKNTKGETEYGFDVFFNSSSGQKNKFYFLWKFVGTFQVETNPELYTEPCGESRCPKPLPCSAYILVGGALQFEKPCECCTCWVSMFNAEPIVSDNQVVKDGRFLSVKAAYVPITEWTFMHKLHAEVRQMSLSRQAFAFWRSVQAQKNATESLFQPLTGKIPSNFVQLSGAEAPIEGLFFATSISKNSIFIKREDVPIQSIIPTVQLKFANSCIQLFPNSTIKKPSFWID